jgi:hypothetical protein
MGFVFMRGITLSEQTHARWRRERGGPDEAPLHAAVTSMSWRSARATYVLFGVAIPALPAVWLLLTN